MIVAFLENQKLEINIIFQLYRKTHFPTLLSIFQLYCLFSNFIVQRQITARLLRLAVIHTSPTGYS